MHILEAAQYFSQIEELTLIIMYIQDSVSSVSLYCRYMYFLTDIDWKPSLLNLMKSIWESHYYFKNVVKEENKQ